MIHQFDYCAAGYVQTDGKRGYNWAPLQWPTKYMQPQYLMGRQDFMTSEKRVSLLRVGFRDIARNTDSRTVISTALWCAPCGNKVPVLQAGEAAKTLALPVVLNTFVFDWLERTRQAGATLNWYILAENVLPPPSEESRDQIVRCSLGLCLPHPRFATVWASTGRHDQRSWKQLWAITGHERKRLRAICEALIALQYGLTEADLKNVVLDTDRSTDHLANKPLARTLNSKGFWKTEKNLPPELRLPVISVAAFRELQHVGVNSFLAMNDGEGWMLPETLRLADYGLGHDDRAKEPQPVASRLGPRFYDWQLEQGVEESWEECERHAEILDRILPAKQDAPEPAGDDGESGAPTPTDLFGNPLPTDLFGNVLLPQKKGRR
jgi:hypothetical protein